ncbi:UvrD-helicase domain-containing protein [Flavobacterium sp. ST-75]|uniref:UvrD-helicase domain-containing protein n=1 Tax=Flavobacterium rhizophilum TaxID=3163296 RepID=A0ABW8YH99_9FLAO
MVDKRIVLAVAGSGKTTMLINQLDLDKNFLLVTYTVSNCKNLKNKVLKKFNYLPQNITILTYFDFIYNTCIKPFLFKELKVKGIKWDLPPTWTNQLNRNDKRFYVNNGYLYHNRMAKLIDVANLSQSVNDRIKKFYNYVLIDEVQDLSGHDFDFVLRLLNTNVNFLLVGDFYQHTYNTSRDGNLHKNLYSNLETFLNYYSKQNITIDLDTLKKSHRCSPTICNYVSENLGISISSANDNITQIKYVDNPTEISNILSDDSIIKLVYNNSNKRSFNSKNWGDCKGEDSYVDTCIILNKTTYNLYKKQNLKSLNPITKNKLYVALTRTRGNCYLIPEDLT